MASSPAARALDDLEAGVIKAERAMRVRDWGLFGEALHDQRVARNMLENAMPDEIEGAERDALRHRIDRVLEVREEQLRRLVAFRNNIGEQLAIIGRFRTAAREVRREDRHVPSFFSAIR